MSLAEAYFSDGSTFTKIDANLVGALPTGIITDTELNNATTTGLYSFRMNPSTDGVQYTPCANWGTLLVDATTGTPFQIYIPDTGFYLYKRNYLSSNTWSKMDAGYADTAGQAANEYSVIVSSSEPTDSRCKIWIQP